MKENYEKDYWENKRKTLKGLGFGFENTVYTKAATVRAKDQFEWIMKVMNKDLSPMTYSPLTVLDIGSGYGGNINIWGRKHFIIGIEPDKKLASRDKRIINGQFEFVSGHYDLLLMSHVLEHFENLESFFKKADDILNPEGIIFVEVPCCDNPEVLALSRSDSSHKHHFLMEDIENVFKEHNYEIVCSESLTSKIDLVTKPGIVRKERFLRVVKTLFSKNKSEPCNKEKADVIRIIAKKR